MVGTDLMGRMASSYIVRILFYENDPLLLLRCGAARWHSGLALLPHSTRDPGLIPGLGLCVESACSPHVCVGFLWVLWFPPTVQKMCRLGGLAMLNCPLVPGGQVRVNAQGYGDRALVGLWLVQT